MKILAVSAASLALGAAIAVGCAYAAPPRNVSPARHPNLAAAQTLTAQAYEKIQKAQLANEFDLGGHADKAKEALKLANDEIKLAAITADHH